MRNYEVSHFLFSLHCFYSNTLKELSFGRRTRNTRAISVASTLAGVILSTTIC